MDPMTKEVTDWWPVLRADRLVRFAVSLGWEPDGPMRYRRLCDTPHWELRLTSGERWMRVGVLGGGGTTPIVGEEAGGPSGVRALGGDAVSAWIAKDVGRDYRRACRPTTDATACLEAMVAAGWQVATWWTMFSDSGQMGSRCRLMSPRGNVAFLLHVRCLGGPAGKTPRGVGSALVPWYGETVSYESTNVCLTAKHVTRWGREKILDWVKNYGRDW